MFLRLPRKDCMAEDTGRIRAPKRRGFPRQFIACCKGKLSSPDVRSRNVVCAPRQRSLNQPCGCGRQIRLRHCIREKPWSRMEQALRAADLASAKTAVSAQLSSIWGSLTPDAVSARATGNMVSLPGGSRANTVQGILLLTQHPCAKSYGAELVLRFQPASAIYDERTVFSGIEPRVEVMRRRFAETPTNVLPLRKPPQSVTTARWQSRTVWAGCK